MASAGNSLEVQILMLHLNQKSKDQGQLVLSLFQDFGACSSLRIPDPVWWWGKWGSETLQVTAGKWSVKFHTVQF